MLTQRLLSFALIGTEWVIWLLLLLSVFSIAVILEKIWMLRKKRGIKAARDKKIIQALQCKDRPGIERVLRDDPTSAAVVTLTVIKHIEETGVDFEDGLLMALSDERVSLEGRIAILGTLGSNAPFVGLFGTVLGIIHAFHSLSMNTRGGPATVMSGISEALVATALGLFVAIPAVAAYNYFVRYIRKIMVTSENFARVVIAAYLNAPKKKG